ncbi:GNAT family N-acetyltransferase [Meiothermus granaticius]|uniref:Acetyltransferase (GNAT) family protein n=1 Tax=Meiothermus granaticius NBRC 107808 TaxID=1227551 RepID=A0A399FB87_9DEIN|nr:GNAT family N-acetyltransferase [Meiothermus granaticius]RIH93403.1 Acetyltransferase (GNAT) family protein [Meiothermus granaticius NBRC 107808]GEM87652.1 N-acetyltransferase [Meiothermus granaticius NBRC 107808]
MHLEVSTYYLESLSPNELRPKRIHLEGLHIVKAEIPSAELQHFLYRSVGGDWYWYEKADWSYAQWLEYAQNPNLHTWVAYLRGTPAGYFQLEAQGEAVEIVYFGLLPQFSGRGLGGHLLTEALEQAWALGPKRVWVHTCSLDSPAALANYQARGMRLYKTETVLEELPDHPPGPWPGAR